MHSVRKPNERNKVVALFFQIFFMQSCGVLSVNILSTIGESIEIVGEDGIDLYITVLNLC